MWIRLVVAFVALASVPAPALAQPEGGTVELGLGGGVFLPAADHATFEPGVEHSPFKLFGPETNLRLAWLPAAALAFEIEGVGQRLPLKMGGEVDVFGARGNLLVQVPLPFSPFVLAGGGILYSRSDPNEQGNDRDYQWHLGVGGKLYGGARQLRVDGRLIRAPRQAGDGETTHFGLTVSLAWTFGRAQPTQVRDSDGDGLDDDIDGCPDEAGNKPTGCPVRDADGDGIDDLVDICVLQAETQNGYRDDDGCPDEWPDDDLDGLPNHRDRCVDQAEDRDGYQDEDGCPELDNDEDGLVDTADQCPDGKGPPENRGCPDSDRDGDGVFDRLDNCPDEAGVAEQQGCKDKQLVVLTKTQIEILDKVYFESSKALIQRRSHALLDNVASVLRSHPEIKKLRVEGHTDSQGGSSANRSLSQDRAQAVVDYLVSQGVEGSRLQAVGHGEDKPIASNRDRDGRAANRRVEFHIEEQASSDP